MPEVFTEFALILLVSAVVGVVGLSLRQPVTTRVRMQWWPGKRPMRDAVDYTVTALAEIIHPRNQA